MTDTKSAPGEIASPQDRSAVEVREPAAETQHHSAVVHRCRFVNLRGSGGFVIYHQQELVNPLPIRAGLFWYERQGF
jgi:hypothetical protein